MRWMAPSSRRMRRREANRTEAALRRIVAELLEAAERTDAAEDALFGPGPAGE